jgi:hypothetical protein
VLPVVAVVLVSVTVVPVLVVSVMPVVVVSPVVLPVVEVSVVPMLVLRDDVVGVVPLVSVVVASLVEVGTVETKHTYFNNNVTENL